ncbi:hypothetical protein [Methylotetracoccus oryzae]|uniref:hypothetical protein n=1 Tax=Methylotetracoccus oryzae TaxID=1919059 RepID=UPI0013A56786|nr:hypothetical protein [Methylotetracoccus oryzae]
MTRVIDSDLFYRPSDRMKTQRGLLKRNLTAGITGELRPRLGALRALSARHWKGIA